MGASRRQWRGTRPGRRDYQRQRRGHQRERRSDATL